MALKMSTLANFDKVKYQFEKNNVIPGNYTIHCPSQCNLKFPKDNRPIHKKAKNAYEGKETISVLQNSKWRQILIPKEEKIIYPTIIHEKQCDELKKCTRLSSLNVSQENALRASEKLEKSQELKIKLKAKQKPQPGYKSEEAESLKDSDIKIHTKKRAIALYNEEFQGARIANQIIMASKCHAIRDAQLKEKIIIKKQIEEENKRMDKIMEKARIAALEKETKEHNERKARRLENINVIKEQIAKNKIAKAQELQNIEKEYTKLNKTGVAMLNDDTEKIKRKKENAARLMEHFNKCNKELLDCKKKQAEEDKILEERIKNFILYRRQREAEIRSEERMKKNAREQKILSIVKAQETAKKLKEEMEMIRLQKIQEDVEREYRAKEKTLALKKVIELKNLKEGREKQIADVRRQIAAEISREEEVFKNIIEKNEKDAMKEKEKLQLRQEALKNHRLSIIKQIDEKERKRIESKERITEEGLVMKDKIEKLDNLEKTVVKQKLNEMREQKIPEVYINEVEHRLAKLNYV